nr:hypothetical protein [Tanacetum cinerariifolium]
MVAYLLKSDASEGFNQIINFLNGSSIKYALTVNPNIYVSCIKQFWTTVAINQVNDVTRLQALVDKTRVVIMEATIREALRLDDEECVDCLPNEEIFAELARMGYEKPSTKLTFYKAFFSSQWKFLIHTILQCMSAKITSWNEFSSSMASAVIWLSSGDLLTHTTKYTFPTLTQKVFANMRRVGKEFFGVETPLFEGMLVEQQVDEEGDVDEHVEEVNAGDAAEGYVSDAHGKVPMLLKNHPFHLLHHLLKHHNHLKISLQLPKYNQYHHNHLRRVEHLEFDKVTQALEITKLKRREKKLDRRNKVRVLKLRRLQKVGTSERVKTSDETVMDDESNQGRMITEGDDDADVVLEDVKEATDEAKEVAEDAKVDENVDIQGRTAESQAEIYKIDLDHANKVLSMQEDETEPAEVQEVVDVVTTAKLITEVVTAASEIVTAASAIIITPEAQVPAATTAVTLTAAPARVTATPGRRKKGVVIRDLQEESTTSTIIPAKTKSKDKEEDKNKALQRLNETLTDRAAKRQKLNEEVEELNRHLQIVPNEDDDVYTEATPLARKVPVVDYQIIELNNKPYYKIIRDDDAHQLKPQTEAQARKNMMLYLKNVVGFKMDYFKGMSYDDIRLIFEAKFNSNVEELNRHLQIVPNEDDDVYTEATPLARKVPVVDYQIIELNNKPYYKIIRDDDTHQLYVIFLSLLRNFDREDLEAFWSLVKERFSTTKPKNFSDDFLLVTLGAMFEKPNIHAQIWKTQRNVHGPAKVKGWKLLESCSVQIITFTSTQLVLLVERKYSLTRFTLD